MTKETLYQEFHRKYEALKAALEGDDIELIRALTLEVHALVHLSKVSDRRERTMADYVTEYMLSGRQNEQVPRQPWDTDLHYAGAERVPMIWQLWHTARIEDLVGNILMADGEQVFNEAWRARLGASITDTGNALEPKEAAAFGRALDPAALLEYMTAVGKRSREIVSNLTLKEIREMVPEERVMRILEEGGVTTDFRSVWLLVFWGRLTRGGMILTPLTFHHMMHLTPCLDHLPIEVR